MTAQTWSSEGYAKNARFVTDLGTPVLELLAPRPGEHILDVGCGDGVLTKKIADLGCSVVGVDSSADFVASARKLSGSYDRCSKKCLWTWTSLACASMQCLRKNSNAASFTG